MSVWNFAKFHLMFPTCLNSVKTTYELSRQTANCLYIIKLPKLAGSSGVATKFRPPRENTLPSIDSFFRLIPEKNIKKRILPLSVSHR